MPKNAIEAKAKEMRVPLALVEWVAQNEKLPVVNFAAGGIATPADAALMMQLGVEGVFVGSGIFKSQNPKKRAQAIVQATCITTIPILLPKPRKAWDWRWRAKRFQNWRICMRSGGCK